MTFYNPERLKTAPLSRVPFGMYQMEEDDTKILKKYCDNLLNFEFKKDVKGTSICNSQEVYLCDADISNVLGNFIMPAMDDIAGTEYGTIKWSIKYAHLQCKRKGDFTPIHASGYSDFSFVCFVNFPYDIEEEMSMEYCKGSINPSPTKLQLIYPSPLTRVSVQDFVFSKADEGLIMIYPSAVMAQLLPFATSDEVQYVIWGSIEAQQQIGI